MSVVLRRQSRAELIGLAVLLPLLFGLLTWAAHYRLDPLDEGYFVYTSSRVLAGELPYRDFATPYTPAFFYLNAFLFRLFGQDLIIVRFSLIVARLGLVLLLYLLARRIMPPAFAIIPGLLMLAMDQAPIAWETHPAWWATLAMLAAVWCVCRERESGGFRWWLAGGLAAGVSFAFKQNIGLFALAALAGAALVEGHALPSRKASEWWERVTGDCRRSPAKSLLRTAGPAYLLVLCLGMTWLMRPHLDPVLVATFALPFGALALQRKDASCSGYVADGTSVGHKLAATLERLGLAVGGFFALTVPWLVVLVLGLGPGETPLAAFVGGLDTAGYYLAMEGLRVELLPVIALVAIQPVISLALFSRVPWFLRVGMLLAGLALAVGLVHELLRPAAEVHPRISRALALLSVKATTNLVLYLPAIAFWMGYGLLIANRVPGGLRFYLRWYLLAGSLLLLNQYPRMDEVHMMFSGLLLWVIGAYLLWRLFEKATRGMAKDWLGRLGRGAMYLTLLGLPLAAAWPMLQARREELIVRREGGPFALATPHYEPLQLPRASVAEIDTIAWKYRTIAAYFWQHSEPGDRIFVYPAAPLLYYLLDRPNATRFNHILPGLLSAADEQETIERLESVPAAYVIWDSFGAEYWGRPGFNRKLTDYIWDHYDPVESIGAFEIMHRRGPNSR